MQHVTPGIQRRCPGVIKIEMGFPTALYSFVAENMQRCSVRALLDKAQTCLTVARKPGRKVLPALQAGFNKGPGLEAHANTAHPVKILDATYRTPQFQNR